MYDPVIARFISPDSIVKDFYDPQTLNRYCYVLNNPVNLVDLFGLDPKYGPAGPYLPVGTSPLNPNLHYGPENLYYQYQKGELFVEFTGKHQGYIKTILGSSGIIFGALAWPEGAPVVALSIPILAEGGTILFIEYGLGGDTTDLPFTIIGPFLNLSKDPCK